MLANFLPSLGLMDDKELLVNIIALGILVITILVDVCIEIATKVFYVETSLFMLTILWAFSVALKVPTSRRILEHQYKELHEVALNHQDLNFSYKKLVHNVKKYWMMAETGNPQFAIACSQVSSAFGVMCLYFAFFSSMNLLNQFCHPHGQSDYKWSIQGILNVQSIGIVIGSIAPIFRCFSTTSYFNLTRRWSINHLNVFRVEKYWTQRLQKWKHSHIPSHIPGRHCKIVFHNVRNIILNFCIALQITTLVICKTICLIPKSFLILFSCCCYFYKSLLNCFKEEPNAYNNNVSPDMEEYDSYVLQIEEDAKLSKRLLRNALSSITRLLHESEKKDSSNLMNLLQKSRGFIGVVEFDNDHVPPLHPEETKNCWSLVAVTLTAIAIALPNIADGHVKGLLASMKEGLQFVRHIEKNLNANGELAKTSKTGRCMWTEVEVYSRWLQIDLQNPARKGNTSKEILQWLGDEATKIEIQFKICKKGSLDHSLHKFIAANSMYRISQTILLHCNDQEDWPKDEELFEWISTVIADILCACFTNLPRVITMKCHHDAIEKREDSIRTAAQLLGKSKKILKILKSRQLPNLDLDSMAYIDKWRALPKSHIPNVCASLDKTQPASSSSNESLIVTIM